MSTIDASQCWRIMPFRRPEYAGGDEWWILGPDHQPVRIVRTKVEAYAIALEHNKQHGVNAVWVHRECMKNGKWVPEDVSKYWHIMPVALPEGGQRYWAFGPDDEAVKASTKEEAYNIALKHNKEHGVDLVYVYDLGGKGGKWEKPPPNLSYYRTCCEN
jgi:hypothetical protein